MTWTAYNPADPTDRDLVRWRIGDVDSTDPKQTDEEIAIALDQAGSVLGAAVLCVRALKARYAATTDQSAVGVTSATSQKFAQYSLLLEALERELSTGGPGGGGTAISAGGMTSLARVRTLRGRSDIPKPKFEFGRDDY